MADQTHLENDPKSVVDYPVPLSPPLPLISKDIELSRAMTAASISSLFCLSRTHVLFEDDWLIAVCKPQGVYCEAVLSSVPSLLSDLPDSGKLLNLIFCLVLLMAQVGSDVFDFFRFYLKN